MSNESSAADYPDRWKEELEKVQKERDQLRQENAQLRTECTQLSKALLAALPVEEITLSKEEILSQMGREKPLREFLEEMRTQLIEILNIQAYPGTPLESA